MCAKRWGPGGRTALVVALAQEGQRSVHETVHPPVRTKLVQVVLEAEDVVDLELVPETRHEHLRGHVRSAVGASQQSSPAAPQR